VKRSLAEIQSAVPPTSDSVSKPASARHGDVVKQPEAGRRRDNGRRDKKLSRAVGRSDDTQPERPTDVVQVLAESPQFQSMQATLDKVAKELALLKSQRSGPPPVQQDQRRAASYYQRGGDGGHFHPDMSYGGPVQTSSPSAQGRQNEFVSHQKRCFICGEPGHFARACPGGQRSTQPNGQGQVAQINSVGQPDHACYLKVKVNGRSCECLLDSGSEVSVLPLSLVKGCRTRPTTKTLRAANKTVIPVLGEAEATIATPKFKSTVTGLVTEHIDEPMLGINWLCENEAEWSFAGSYVTLAGQRHDLIVRPGKQRCRRVILQQNVKIPPRSQVDLPCKVVLPGQDWISSRNLRAESSDDNCWGTKPTPLRHGVYVARTVTPVYQFNDVPVRVMNVQNQPRSIKAGTVVSDLETVTPITNLDSDERATASLIGKVSGSRSSEEQKKRVSATTVQNETVPEYIEKLISDVDGATPESSVMQLRSLLLVNRHVFSESENDLGRTDIVEHHIDTGDSKPVRQQLRRHPPAHVEAISTHVDSMLAQGVIEPASSPWASNVVLVKKKDGTYRCCIDYRQLNNVTVKDRYPLPRIDASLDAMSQARWFSTFDLRSSYHQLMVRPEDRSKTAFICPRGMYRFRAMPFGLCNAGATFQRLMDIVMSGLNLEVCLVYLDDIVVYARTPEEHLERLRIVLDRLGRAGLKLKPEKCRFFQRSVKFLGHVISHEGIGTDPDKIQAVVDWPVPTSVTETRSYVGLASYYRRFVPNFAKLAAPLHALTRKDVKFQWTTEAQKAFDALKSALTSPPILAMPNDVGEFILDCDASQTNLGAVLSQRQDGVERVIAYASRSLDRREVNYCTSRKELLAIVYFLKYFKQYLLGRTFKVRTDHAALTWLRKTPDPIGQQARWLEQMEEFDFVVEHRPGVRHGNADALSRRPCVQKNCMCKDTQQAFSDGPADRPTLKAAIDVPTVMDDNETELKKISSDATARKLQIRELHLEVEEVPDAEPSPHDGLLTEPQVHGELCSDRAPHVGMEPRGELHVEAAADVEPHVGVEMVRKPRVGTNAEEQPHVGMEVEAHSHVGAPVRGPPADLWEPQSLLEAQKRDPDIAFVYEKIAAADEKPTWNDVSAKSRETKVLCSFWPRLSIRDEILVRLFESESGTDRHYQVILPKVLREQFLELTHVGAAGHLGFKKSAAAVQARAYWPTWSSDLTLYLKRCKQCSQYHRGTLQRHAEMQIPQVGEPWERVSVDITGPHPRSSRQNQYILTLVDHFSKWAEAIPLPNHTAPTVARALVTHVFSRFGTPLQLLTDRGSEFESELFSNLMKWLNVDKLRTTVFKPSTNGTVERFHRTLNSMMGKVVSDSQRDWDDRLPYVLAAYRASIHDSTGYSSNRLFLGRENRMPVDLAIGLSAQDRDPAETIDDYVYRQQELAEDSFKVVRDHLQTNAERRKRAYDTKVRSTTFAVGEWVWYYYPRRYQKKSPKWQRSFIGPFLIVRRVPPVNYVLQRSRQSKPFVVHGDKIKRCYGETPTAWVQTASNAQEAESTLTAPRVAQGQRQNPPNNLANTTDHARSDWESVPCTADRTGQTDFGRFLTNPCSEPKAKAPREQICRRRRCTSGEVQNLEEEDQSLPPGRSAGQRNRAAPRHLRDYVC